MKCAGERLVCLAEGVMLSGAKLQRLHTDSTPEKSAYFKQKDAEGVRPVRVNLSGKRTEIKFF